MAIQRAARQGVLALLATLGVAGLLLSPSRQDSRARAARRPNIVVIVLDDATSEMLADMPRVQRRIASRGVVMVNAMVPTALCCPSRASLLTGDYAHTTGVWGNKAPGGGFSVFDDRSTIATWLNAAGYRTGLFGKYLNQYEYGYIPPGWDRWFATSNGGYERVPFTRTDGSFHHTAPGVYAPYFFADKLSSFVRSTPARVPFFGYFAPFNPHKPAKPAPQDAGSAAGVPPWRPPNYDEADRSDKPPSVQVRTFDPDMVDALYVRRQEALASIDRAIGRIMGVLRRAGRVHNTLVIVMSDNGLLLGEHGLFGKGLPYEAATRVFLTMRFDPGSWSGVRPGMVAANIDLAPTIESVTGVDFPRMDGRDLSNMIATGTPPRNFLTLESKGKGAGYCGLRSIDTLFVHYGDGFEELYDYTADPYEMSNVAGDPANAALVDDLRARAKRRCHPLPPGFSW